MSVLYTVSWQANAGAILTDNGNGLVYLTGCVCVCRYRWYNLGTTAKQVAMVWACVAKRTHWLGKEMYGIWGGGLPTDYQARNL